MRPLTVRSFGCSNVAIMLGSSAKCAPAFDCGACGAPLSLVRSQHSAIGYYRCPQCDRQFATVYADALLRAARPHRSEESAAEALRRDREISELRQRLERWRAQKQIAPISEETPG
jgi:uncharacterized Zn finger protein (UPF0148 family)